jgi:hypothetical protein
LSGCCIAETILRHFGAAAKLIFAPHQSFQAHKQRRLPASGAPAILRRSIEAIRLPTSQGPSHAATP